MHILTFALMFIIGSIGAASHGDWSGMEAIGKFILFVVMFFLMAAIILNPPLLIIAIIVIILILVACCSK